MYLSGRSVSVWLRAFCAMKCATRRADQKGLVVEEHSGGLRSRNTDASRVSCGGGGGNNGAGSGGAGGGGAGNTGGTDTAGTVNTGGGGGGAGNNNSGTYVAGAGGSGKAWFVYEI